MIKLCLCEPRKDPIRFEGTWNISVFGDASLYFSMIFQTCQQSEWLVWASNVSWSTIMWRKWDLLYSINRGVLELLLFDYWLEHKVRCLDWSNYMIPGYLNSDWLRHKIDQLVVRIIPQTLMLQLVLRSDNERHLNGSTFFFFSWLSFN